MKRKPAIIRRRVLPVATIPEKLVLEFKRFFSGRLAPADQRMPGKVKYPFSFAGLNEKARRS
jgi:hypothetical protein